MLSRLTLAVTALSLGITLSACSGDDEDPSADESASAASESPTLYPVRGCEAEIEVSDPLGVSWSGEAQAIDSDASTSYQWNKGTKNWIALTIPAGDAAPNLTLAVKDETYPAAPEDVDVTEADGTVEVTAKVKVTQGKTARIDASFACDEAGA